MFSLSALLAGTTYVLACVYLKISRSTNDDGWIFGNFAASDVHLTSTYMLQLLDAVYLSLATITSVGYGDMMALTSGEKQFTVVIIILGGFVLAFTIGSLENKIAILNTDVNKFGIKMRRVLALLDHIGCDDEDKKRVRLSCWFSAQQVLHLILPVFNIRS